VTLHDYGEDEQGRLYMVFEFLEGEELKEILRREQRFSPERAVEIALQVLGALAEAHAKGMVHRDLKPENIMITQTNLGEERAKVLDFGIAKLMGSETWDGGVETRQGLVLGTPLYMSPEQSLDQRLDGRSDLYALGIILYEMLLGRVPFDGDQPLEILVAHINEPLPPIPPSAGLPKALSQLIQIALSKRPEDRFKDAEEMARALREVLKPGTELPRSQPAPTPKEPSSLKVPPLPQLPSSKEFELPSEKNSSKLGLTLLLLLLFVLAAAFWFFKSKDPNQLEPARVNISVGGDEKSDALAPVLKYLRSGDREKAVELLALLLGRSAQRKELARRVRQIPELAPLLSHPNIDKHLR